MIELSGTQQGELGKAVLFSDLYASAVMRRFTGGFLLRSGRDYAVFFRDGCPVHAGGQGFSQFFLGEILVKNGACPQSALSAAVEKQAGFQGSKPLLGAILVSDAGVSPDAIKDAVRTQTVERVKLLFGLLEGSYQYAQGENARIREIGVVAGGLELLAEGLRTNASDGEFKRAADALLGQAVQLKGDLPEDLRLTADEKKVLRYLDKPRKPDQLERASNRRLVRVILRLLLVLERAKLSPAAKAIPIPKATLLKAPIAAGLQPPMQSEPEPEAQPAQAAPPPTAQAAEPPPPPPKPERPDNALLLEEMRKFHEEMGPKNHFEILDIKMDAPPGEIKKAFHVLAKKYHPDAFPEALSEEDARIVREVSARVNEAYQVLSNDKSRGDYLRLVRDERIKGDSRKAEKIRDAEVKHQMGVVMLRKKDYQTAREYFTYAVENDPDSGEYKSSLAWAMFADAKFDRSIALQKGHQLLLDALKVKGASAQTYYYMGQVLKARNQVKEAMQHFKRAVMLDPRHVDAQREIRLVEMREKKEDEDEGSTISKLFKR